MKNYCNLAYLWCHRFWMCLLSVPGWAFWTSRNIDLISPTPAEDNHHWRILAQWWLSSAGEQGKISFHGVLLGNIKKDKAKGEVGRKLGAKVGLWSTRICCTGYLIFFFASTSYILNLFLEYFFNLFLQHLYWVFISVLCIFSIFTCSLVWWKYYLEQSIHAHECIIFAYFFEDNYFIKML